MIRQICERARHDRVFEVGFRKRLNIGQLFAVIATDRIRASATSVWIWNFVAGLTAVTHDSSFLASRSKCSAIDTAIAARLRLWQRGIARNDP